MGVIILVQPLYVNYAFSIEANKCLSDGSVCHIVCSFSTYLIQFKIICIALSRNNRCKAALQEIKFLQ